MIVNFDEWSNNKEKYPKTEYTPIGVVVVPASHNVYGDGSCAIVSLKYMSLTNPNDGSISNTFVGWGERNSSIKELRYDSVAYVGHDGTVKNKIIGVNPIAIFPSDKDTFTAVTNPYDAKTKYYKKDSYYAPSPYLNDGSRNPIYYQTTSPSTTANCLSTFNGVENTQKMIELATGQTDWKTASAITNSGDKGYYPAACCCWRYRTEGTNEGDWYLPAMGELGYLMVRFKVINDTIQKLIDTYGQEIGSLIPSLYSHLSSVEKSESLAYCLGTYIGDIDSSDKVGGFYVRSFCRIKP